MKFLVGHQAVEGVYGLTQLTHDLIALTSQVVEGHRGVTHHPLSVGQWLGPRVDGTRLDLHPAVTQKVAGDGIDIVGAGCVGFRVAVGVELDVVSSDLNGGLNLVVFGQLQLADVADRNPGQIDRRLLLKAADGLEKDPVLVTVLTTETADLGNGQEEQKPRYHGNNTYFCCCVQFHSLTIPTLLL